MNDLVEKFNKFIKKWCENHYAHLIDNDENDGEEFRQLLEKTYSEEEIKKLKNKIRRWTPFLNRNKTLMCREQVLCLIEELFGELR